MQTGEGKLYLFVAIDRTSKFAVTQLVDTADRKTAWEFLEHVLAAVPYHIHTILTDRAIGTYADGFATGSRNRRHVVRETMARGIQFADQPRNRNTATSRQMRFDMICEIEPWLRHRFEKPWRGGIEHRLTQPNHPWTNGQVERIPLTLCRQTVAGHRNRTIKEATVKRFHYERHDQLRTHLADFLAAYNFARRLKTLSGLTPYEYICKIWTSEPDRFILDPIHQMPGLNT